jgi:UDP-GlcNAc:undecaprenyl-phosphate GlcNAc-1-phosphate transferase
VRYVVLATAAALLSASLMPLLGRLAHRLDAIDRPATRKVHAAPVPRLGGAGIVVAGAITLTGALAADALGVGPGVDLRAWAAVLAGASLIFGVGLWDDVRGVPAPAKLAVQTMAAAVAMALGVWVHRITFLGATWELGLLAVPVTLLWIVGITNAFNLLDGLDGLAAGLAIIASATCGAILVARGDAQGGMVLAILLGATCGFLPYNVSPARVFLGDAGSLLIGYVLAVTAVTGVQKGATALAVAVPLLMFALPIAETVSSAARRFAANPGPPAAGAAPGMRLVARRLRRMLEADRAHLHHRLVDQGLSSRSVVLLLCGLSLCLSLLALASARIP